MSPRLLLPNLFRRSRPIDRPSRPAKQKSRPQLEALESRVVLYTASGNAWPAPQLITLSFMPDGTNFGGNSSNLQSTLTAKFGSASAWQNLIINAAQLWAQQTNINFAVVPDNGAPEGSGSNQQGDPGFGDIRIGGYNFGTNSLAQAFMPPPVNNYSAAGDIAFNTSQVFNNGGTYDLTTVAAHEIGHALGLYHSAISSAEMYSSYNGVKWSLRADDIAGIQSIYGGARTVDQYEGTSGDDSYNTAYNINSLINTSNLTALVTNADITTTNDRDYYVLNVPSGTNGTMTVKMQSQGLSLLEPQLTVYNASYGSVGSVNGTNYGDTVSVTVTGVTAAQQYFIQAFTPVSSAVGTGEYALSVTFGDNPTPIVPLPNTTDPNGTPFSSGGGQAESIDVFYAQAHPASPPVPVTVTPTAIDQVIGDANLFASAAEQQAGRHRPKHVSAHGGGQAENRFLAQPRQEGGDNFRVGHQYPQGVSVWALRRLARG
jgi:hypothetical protein